MPYYALTAFRMVLGVPTYIVGLFAVKRTGYGAIGIIYGILAGGCLTAASGPGSCMFSQYCYNRC